MVCCVADRVFRGTAVETTVVLDEGQTGRAHRSHIVCGSEGPPTLLLCRTFHHAPKGRGRPWNALPLRALIVPFSNNVAFPPIFFRSNVCTILLRYDRLELSLPLRPANPRKDDHRDYGAMEVAITYTDDYVGQG